MTNKNIIEELQISFNLENIKKLIGAGYLIEMVLSGHFLDQFLL